MPGVVEPSIRQPCLSDDLFPLVVVGVRVERPGGLRREDPVAFLPELPRSRALPVLGNPVLAQQLDQLGWQPDRAAPGGRLRVGGIRTGLPSLWTVASFPAAAVPDPRDPRGMRYPLTALLAVAVSSRT